MHITSFEIAGIGILFKTILNAQYKVFESLKGNTSLCETESNYYRSIDDKLKLK